MMQARGLVKYWIVGELWFTEEAAQTQCKVIHHRMGMRQAPVEVLKAADVARELLPFLHKLLEGREDEQRDVLDEAQRLLERIGGVK